MTQTHTQPESRITKLFRGSIELDFLAILMQRPYWLPEGQRLVPEKHIHWPLHHAIYCLMSAGAHDAMTHTLPVNLTPDCLYSFAARCGLDKTLDTKVWNELRVVEARAKNIDAPGMWLQTVSGLNTVARQVDLYRMADRIQDQLVQPGEADIVMISNEVQTALATLSSNLSTRARSFGDFDPKKVFSNVTGWCPSFMPAIGRFIRGFRPGTLTVIGAFLGVGKSSMLLNLGLDAMKSGLPCLYLDVEMSLEEQITRVMPHMLDIEADVLEKAVKLGDPIVLARITEARETLLASNFRHVPYDISQPIQKAIDEIQSFRREFPGPAVICLDYLKVDDGGSSRSPEWERLGGLVEELKRQSEKLNVPIISACQLNRQAEGKGQMDFINEGLSYIGGSLKIAQVANTVIALRQLTDAETQRVESMGLRDGEGVGPNRLRFNQVAHVLKARGGERFPAGVPMYLRYGLTRYIEMGHVFTDEAAGIRAVDDHGRFTASPEMEFLHTRINKSVKAAKSPFPATTPIQAAAQTETQTPPL